MKIIHCVDDFHASCMPAGFPKPSAAARQAAGCVVCQYLQAVLQRDLRELANLEQLIERLNLLSIAGNP